MKEGEGTMSKSSGTDLTRRLFIGSGALAAAGMAGAAEAAESAKAKTGAPILLKGGTVLTLDRAVGDFATGDVLIEGKHITQVAQHIEPPTGALTIDAARAIVMPGFVDTHHHLWESIVRNSAPDDTLPDYYKHVGQMLGPAYAPEDAYAADLVGALGTLNAGTTTVLDWSQIQNTPAHSDACVAGLKESGSRAIFGFGFPSLADPKAFWFEPGAYKYPEDIRRLKKQYFSSDDQLLTLALAAVAPGGPGGPEDKVAALWQTARDVGARISVHVGTLGKAGFLEGFGRKGLLRSDVTYIHCNALNDTEWKMIADSGGSVSSAPFIEMVMGHGVPALQRAIDFGIRPSLSVDVETEAPGDFFTVMRAAVAVQRMLASERLAKGDKAAPKWLTARDVLEFATIEGARACGLDHKIGTLTPGKEADIILLRADRFNTMPLDNAEGAVLLSMDSSNVDTILVAGKIVKRNGRLLGHDAKRIAALVDAARDRVMAKANYSMPRV
jgi:cytosine/adenosine deaminase-related metal-dependent hydrolase